MLLCRKQSERVWKSRVYCHLSRLSQKIDRTWWVPSTNLAASGQANGAGDESSIRQYTSAGGRVRVSKRQPEELYTRWPGVCAA